MSAAGKNVIKNFESIVTELAKIAPTPKAVAFVEKLAAQIRARGDSWIEANEIALHINSDAENQYFEVSANRLFFLERWQVALA